MKLPAWALPLLIGAALSAGIHFGFGYLQSQPKLIASVIEKYCAEIEGTRRAALRTEIHNFLPDGHGVAIICPE